MEIAYILAMLQCIYLSLLFQDDSATESEYSEKITGKYTSTANAETSIGSAKCAIMTGGGKSSDPVLM